MAKNCIACNKNIGMLSVRIQLLEKEELFICSNCFGKMPPIINELYQERIYPTKTELLAIKEDIIRQLEAENYNRDTLSIVAKFLDIKIEKARESENNEDGAVIKICPVCNKRANYAVSICPDCNYKFNLDTKLNQKEVAQIYNERIAQYTKNPFYEYDYVIVPNNSDGTTNKEQINQVLISHATQGWRLVTMYSNEIGKNVITVAGVGTNVTICEEVMVFERCIKGEG